MAHEARQVLEVAPEVVDLFRRKIHDAVTFRVNALVATAAQLHCAHHVQRSDGHYIRCSERDASELCFRVSGGNSEAGEIYRITDDAGPHSLSRFLLSKDRDAGSDLAQTVQTY